MLSKTFGVLFVSLFVAIQGKMTFVMKNCGATDFLDLKSRTVAPYPIPIPGDVVVTGEVALYQWPAGGKYDVEVHVESYVGFFWITVPCISNVGSCTYDACDMLNTFNATGCPPQLRDEGIPCTCETLHAGTYKLSGAKFQIPKLDGVWSWLATGDYKVTFKLKDHATKNELACLHGEITLVDGDACSGFLCSIFG